MAAQEENRFIGECFTTKDLLEIMTKEETTQSDGLLCQLILDIREMKKEICSKLEGLSDIL